MNIEELRKFLDQDYDVVAPGGDLTGMTLRNMLSRGLAIELIMLAFAAEIAHEQREACAKALEDIEDDDATNLLWRDAAIETVRNQELV